MTLSDSLFPILTQDLDSSVVQKLMFFTAAMVILPVLAFFIVQQFTANTLVSGGLAALAANLVLIGYVVMAFREDTTQEEAKLEEKKRD